MIRHATLVAGLVLVFSRFAAAQGPGGFAPKIEANQGDILLHLNANGKDRVFIIDSGSPISTFDPKQWGTPEDRPYLSLDIRLGGSRIVKVMAESQGQMAIYSDDPKPAALLGRDFLSQVVMMFDRRCQMAWLWPSSSASARSILSSLSVGVKAATQPWTVTKSPTHSDSGLIMPLWIASKKLKAEIDTGCPGSIVVEDRIRSVEHWPYLAEDTVWWDQPLSELYSLVVDLKTPFVDLPLASVANLASNGECDAWIGEDLLNRGRWIMDVGHGLFAFQAYAEQPLASIYLSGAILILEKGGKFRMAADWSQPGAWGLDSINGKKPIDLFGDFSKAADHAAYARRMARELKTIGSKTFKVKLRDGDDTYDMSYETRVSGKTQSVAEFAANEALEEAKEKKEVPGPSYADATGLLFHPDPLKGPVVLPQGTKFEAGGWKVSHTDRGSAILQPPGWEAVDGFEDTVCVFRPGVADLIKIPLPGPGGEIRVPPGTRYVGPESWRIRQAQNGAFEVFAPSGAPQGAKDKASWVLAADGAKVDRIDAGSKPMPANSLVSVPAGWTVRSHGGRLSVLSDASHRPATAVDLGPNLVKLGPIVMYSEAQSEVSGYVFVAPRGWAVERAPSGVVFLIGPSYTVGSYADWLAKSPQETASSSVHGKSGAQ